MIMRKENGDNVKGKFIKLKFRINKIWEYGDVGGGNMVIVKSPGRPCFKVVSSDVGVDNMFINYYMYFREI